MSPSRLRGAVMPGPKEPQLRLESSKKRPLWTAAIHSWARWSTGIETTIGDTTFLLQAAERDGRWLARARAPTTAIRSGSNAQARDRSRRNGPPGRAGSNGSATSDSAAGRARIIGPSPETHCERDRGTDGDRIAGEGVARRRRSRARPARREVRDGNVARRLSGGRARYQLAGGDPNQPMKSLSGWTLQATRNPQAVHLQGFPAPSRS